MRKYYICAMTILITIALFSTFAFSQTQTKDNPAQAQQASPAPIATQPDTSAKAVETSIYGEVQSVNMQASSMSVQYYDYDNDMEKTTEVTLDKDSKLENVKTIGEVKKGDWVDVVYTVNGNKNIAKTVSVEVEEPAAEASAPVGTTE